MAALLLAAACGSSGSASTTVVPSIATVPAVTTVPPTLPPEPATTTSAATTTATTTTATTTTTVAATVPPPPLQGLALQLITDELAQPTAVAVSRDGALYVAERFGMVQRIGVDGDPEPFLDLTDRVGSIGIEQGLLGIAFHPVDGSVVAYYTDLDGDRRLSVLATAGDGGPPTSERILFDLAQPEGSVDIRHYGGMVRFGPDGHLYVSSGDGADFRNRSAADPGTPFGAILRLRLDEGDPYGVPDDNPFVAGGGAREVWAYGLRNPWRFAIDDTDGLFYVADVGLESREEVNVVPLAGGGWDFGWPAMEGTVCLESGGCDEAAMTMPVLEYRHDQGCSITGGEVYRGAAIPELAGHYFYADWCAGWVRSFRYQGERVTEEQDWAADLPAAGQVNTFGVDGDGELLLANFAGELYRVVPVR